MHLIELTHGRFAKVDDEDVELLIHHQWHASPGANDNWYATTSVPADGGLKKLAMHRLLLNAPEGLEVDHINGDGLDNRRINLRLCTHAENMRNTGPRGGTSQYKGVQCRPERGSRPWQAMITSRGTTYNLGFFADEVEAAQAYDMMAGVLHGEFARLNFPVREASRPAVVGEESVTLKRPLGETKEPISFRVPPRIKGLLVAIATYRHTTMTSVFTGIVVEGTDEVHTGPIVRTGTTMGITVALNVRVPTEIRMLLMVRASCSRLSMTDWLVDAIVEKARREGIE